MPLPMSYLSSFLIAVLVTHSIGSATSYGFDCSFPIHNVTLQCDPSLLAQRQAVYEEYMEGCGEEYDLEWCEENEDKRIAMNIRQPQSMVNYTETGFRKARAPESLVSLLKHFWETNKDDMVIEPWPKANIYTNHWESPTYMVSVENTDLEGAGKELKDAIWKAAEDGIKEWTNMKLRPSSCYGIRVYKEGSILNPHVDRNPLISSAIVNVAQDVDEPWPLEVYDRSGNAVNITMEPFDMVFYESHSLIHGRPFALKGRYYANVFIHFEPVDALGSNEPQARENDRLPPYILANSPEADHWLEQNPSPWSKEFAEDDMLKINSYAMDGDLEHIREMVEKDPAVINSTDDNGWQPLHEATRSGHLDVVQYLLENGAEVNARTHDDEGPSPLHIAKREFGIEHPVYLELSRAGAMDIASSIGTFDWHEEDWDDEEDWEDETGWYEENWDDEDDEEDENEVDLQHQSPGEL